MTLRHYSDLRVQDLERSLAELLSLESISTPEARGELGSILATGTEGSVPATQGEAAQPEAHEALAEDRPCRTRTYDLAIMSRLL